MEEMMKVLVVEPEKVPYEKEIPTGLASLQKEVGGWMEAVYPFEDDVALICNEEGKLMGLPMNRALRDDNGQIYDIVSGTFLVVGLGEETFTSLSNQQTEKYKQKFLHPELFLPVHGKYQVIRLPIPNEYRTTKNKQERGER